MLKHCIFLMLVLLFAGQTIAATFDAHTAHQQSNEHRTFEHSTVDQSHQSHQEQQLNLEKSVENYQFDCHHCCHCHAPASVYIIASLNNHYTQPTSLKPVVITRTMISRLLSPEHRPPKTV